MCVPLIYHFSCGHVAYDTAKRPAYLETVQGAIGDMPREIALTHTHPIHQSRTIVFDEPCQDCDRRLELALRKVDDDLAAAARNNIKLPTPEPLEFEAKDYTWMLRTDLVTNGEGLSKSLGENVAPKGKQRKSSREGKPGPAERTRLGGEVLTAAGKEMATAGSKGKGGERSKTVRKEIVEQATGNEKAEQVTGKEKAAPKGRTGQGKSKRNKAAIINIEPVSEHSSDRTESLPDPSFLPPSSDAPIFTRPPSFSSSLPSPSAVWNQTASSYPPTDGSSTFSRR